MTDTVDKIVIQSETQGVQQSTNDVQGLTKAMDGVTVASQNVEKSTGSIDSKFAALERRFSTTAGQATQLARVQKSVNDAVAANPALQDRANEVLAAATARYGTAASAEKALTQAHAGLDAQGQSLFHSIRSVGEQIALGVPVTQALTGQLNHLSFAASGQGGLSGAFGQVTGLLGGFVSTAAAAVTSGTALTAGVLTLGGAAIYASHSWDSAQKEINTALIGIGGRSGNTVQSINDFAKANATASGLSIDQARNVAVEFTKTGNITVASLKGVGDAVRGFSILTGQDAADAAKTLAQAFSGDLVKGAQDLDKTYGFLNTSIMDQIRVFQLQGDRAKAVQLIINSIADDNKRAEASVGTLAAAYNTLANAASKAKNALAGAQTPQEIVDQSKQPRSTGTTPGGYFNSADAFRETPAAVKKAQDAIDSVNFSNVIKQYNGLSTAGDNAVKSIIPQIDAIDQLEKKLKEIQDAKAPWDAASAGTDTGKFDAATQAIQNQIAGLKDAQGQAERYNQRVAKISTQWGDVGQSTALALQAAQNQLPVLEAVGGGAKMAAQYVADYKNYMDQGKTSTEAAALAASNLAAAQAQVNSAAREQLQALQDANALSNARTPIEAAHAQAQMTFNALLRQGVDEQLAMNTAAQQEKNARDQIYQQAERMVEASRDQVALANTQGTADQASVKAAIARRQALEAGADSTQAAIIGSNAGAVAAAQWADQAQRMADAYEQAARAASKGSFNFDPDPKLTTKTSGAPVSTVDYGAQQLIISHYTARASLNAPDAAAKTGSIDSAINFLKGASPALDINQVIPGAGANDSEFVAGTTYADIGVKGGGSTAADIANAVSQLYDLKISSAKDNPSKLAATNDELAYLQGQPRTLQTLTKIESLKNSIDQLKTSTDSLTATNQDLLSPYYSQDPRTSHIGFRSQGMATGGWVDVPGAPSSNDNMIATIPVAGGERIYVDPNPSKRGGGSSQGGGGVIVNLGGLTVNTGGAPADANVIGRTVYQMIQAAGNQLQRASR